MYRSHTLEVDIFLFVVKRALYVKMNCEIYCEFVTQEYSALILKPDMYFFPSFVACLPRHFWKSRL